MKYVCLVYFAPGAMAHLTPDERSALDKASLEYDLELQRRGKYIAASALQGAASAVSIRRPDGQRSVTDGPFAETREVLGGFIFIEAADRDEAIEIAANIPVGRYATIEVRPELVF